MNYEKIKFTPRDALSVGIEILDLDARVAGKLLHAAQVHRMDIARPGRLDDQILERAAKQVVLDGIAATRSWLRGYVYAKGSSPTTDAILAYLSTAQ